MTNPRQPLAAAYGGEGWSPRTEGTRAEMGTLWGDWGSDSEWRTLEAVLLHSPGPELSAPTDPNTAQMLAPVDPGLAAAQHGNLAQVYRDAGVAVHTLAPGEPVPPNTVFQADLFFMTPQGVVLARPASTVRAGEERFVALRLAALGVPILRSVHGTGTFEGADALWLDEETAMVATGLRTNEAGARQVCQVLKELGAGVVRVRLPRGAMHLMGSVRLLGPRLAAVWPDKLPQEARECLRARDFRMVELPDEEEGRRMAINGVALAPGRFLMPEGCPRTRAALEAGGVECLTVEIGELRKAAGGMGCMTGVLKREMGEGRAR